MIYNIYIYKYIYIYIYIYIYVCIIYTIYVGESNRIWTVPEYGHSRYLRNRKSYKKIVDE